VVPKATTVDVGGRLVRLTNLDKVLYPSSGFTKAEVISYYAGVAAVMVPHIAGRPLTFTRWPNGVDGASFFEKNRPSHAPDWVESMEGPGGVMSSTIDHAAGLVWAGNQAALEIHVPMSLGHDLDTPTTLAFDLDPGAPADIVDCADVALWLRDVLDSVGLVGFAKTSGSKGMQVYVPLNSPTTYEHSSGFALAVGQLLSKQHPERVLVEMTKAKRRGKVFVDWSQNNRAKTTIGVYSLRARERPTVSTPMTWDEVEQLSADRDAASVAFEAADVLARIEENGDLFGPVVDLVQELPGG
jgi:bifunctional non-homologous end joining protein LigD